MTSNEETPRVSTKKKDWTTFLTEKPKSFTEVHPHILAIVQYQKAKYDPNPQPLFVYHSPADGFKSDEEELTSTNSDQCEVNSNLAEHIHSDSSSDFEFSVDKTPCIFAPPTYEMLNARNLSGLLTENTDEHASHFIVFTCYGTLMGYSDSVKLKFARKVSALTGVTWRRNEEALYEAAEHDEALLGGVEGPVTPSPTLLETLSVTAKDNDGRLTSMVVDAGGMIAAVCAVKATILVAALVHIDMAAESKKLAADAKENPEPAQTMQTLSSGDSGDVTSSDGYSDTDSYPGEDRSSSAKGKGKETEEDRRLQKQRRQLLTDLSQIRILSWRAEAMAEALRDDLRGFTLPDGAY